MGVRGVEAYKHSNCQCFILCGPLADQQHFLWIGDAAHAKLSILSCLDMQFAFLLRLLLCWL